MYCHKCSWNAFKNGRLEFGLFNYLKKEIKENYDSQDMYLLYKYLLEIEPEQMSIYVCLNRAKDYATKEKHKAEQEKLNSINIGSQTDYGDLLKCL